MGTIRNRHLSFSEYQSFLQVSMSLAPRMRSQHVLLPSEIEEILGVLTYDEQKGLRYFVKCRLNRKGRGSFAAIAYKT